MIFLPLRAMGAEKRNSVFYFFGPNWAGIGGRFSMGMIVEYTWQDCMCVHAVLYEWENLRKRI